MMNMKKLLALLLVLTMVLGMFPMGALADETEPTETVPETTGEAQVISNDCTVCGEADCTATHVQCVTCLAWDCKETHETVPTTTETEPQETTEPTTAPTSPAEKCGICEGAHKTESCTLCLFCKAEPCSCVTCSECGVKNDHTSTCTKGACADCGKTPCECEAEETTAPTEETTVPTTEAVEVCEYCGVELTEDAVHEDDCLSLCTCEPDGNVHKLGCLFYLGDMVYSGMASSGVTATVYASGEAFPAGTTMTVSDTSVDEDAIYAIVNGNVRTFSLRRNASSSNAEILGIKAVDISFGGEQPSEPVALTITVPDSEVPSGANQAIIVHFGEYGPEKVASEYLVTNVDVHSFSVDVDGFSSYAVVFVNGKYQSRLLRDVLAESPEYSSRYSIHEFPVDLINYDPLTFNKQLNGPNKFMFTSYGETVGTDHSQGINDGTSTYANQGILQDTLDANGLPQFKYVSDANTGAKYFDSNTNVNGKTMYNDIPFEFIYDNQSGYYEYKSSANHAQLNAAEYKVELYADTLATQNVNAATKVTLDLTKDGSGTTSDLHNVDKTATLYKATAQDKDTGENHRLDPYVGFETGENGIDASTVSKIYVKARIPANVGPNQFQLFFRTEAKNYNEEMSYLIDYTPNGDWIEFVVDTEGPTQYGDTNLWTGTITGIRVDLFDAHRPQGHTQNTNVHQSIGSYPIEISEITFIKSEGTHTTYGGFYPFTDIAKSYPGNNDAFSLSAWQEKMSRNEVSIDTASRSMGNPALTNADLFKELAYATVMEFDFYLPVDMENMEGNDLTYFFNGDDDLWVFVDGQLVLDIGGGHGAIQGWVNFTEGTTWVESAVQITGYNSHTNNYEEVSGTLPEALRTPGRHTMKVFYMERCGSVSNCQMKFNLPQVPSGAVAVSKEVAESTGADTSVLKEENFTFEIKAKNMGAGSDGGDNLLAEYDYYLVDYTTGKPLTTEKKTSANGTFTLKHNQDAIFDIDENFDVTVKEIIHQVDGYTNGTVTINGQSRTDNKLTQRTAENANLAYQFLNTYTETHVEYKYVAVNPEGCPAAEVGKVKDPASANYGAQFTESVGVRVDEPVGSNAQGSATVKFAGWYADEGCNTLVSEDAAFVPEHPQKDGNVYVGNTYYAKFEFLYGNLEISKTGIQTIDNDADEQQTTIYEVKGTSTNGTVIDLEVAIVGNGHVMIKQLPVGKYTVTEKTNWSWRYTTANNGREVEILGNQTTETEFVNTRVNKLWLSGDSVAKNAWDENNTITATGNLVTVN